MSLKSDLYGYLSGLTTITNEISTRLYPSDAPTSATLPYATFEQISSQHEMVMESAAGLAMATIQIDVFDDSPVDAESAAEAFRTVMQGIGKGVINGGGSTDVRHITLTDKRDDFIPPDDGAEVGTFNVSMDFDIWYVESVPTFPAS